MDKILHNLALLATLQFCKEQGLDCSNTHLYKTGRKYRYTLLTNDTKTPVCSVEFHTNRKPSYLAYTTN